MTQSEELKMIVVRLMKLQLTINGLPLLPQLHGLRDALAELTECVVQLTMTLDPNRPPPITLAKVQQLAAECRQEPSP